jgi:hypothetical protein
MGSFSRIYISKVNKSFQISYFMPPHLNPHRDGERQIDEKEETRNKERLKRARQMG